LNYEKKVVLFVSLFERGDDEKKNWLKINFHFEQFILKYFLQQ